MNKKELYVKPELEIKLFETEDIITTSDEGWTGWYPINLSSENSNNGRY